jgi:MFS family permease
MTITTAHSGTSVRRAVYTLAAVNLVALGSMTAPAVAGLPLKVADAVPEEQRSGALAVVLALGGVAALIANPLFGALSDRTRGPFGRRRPWMLGGTIAGLGGIVGVTASADLAVIAASWIVVQVAFNATLAAAAALLADIVPDERRAAASGIFTGAAFLGALPPLVLAALFPRNLDAVSFVMPVVALAVMVFAMRLPDASAPTRGISRALDSGSLPRRIPAVFAAVWLQRFAMQSAFSLTTAFTFYLIMDRMATASDEATPTATIATLVGGAAIVVAATVVGSWASRRGGYIGFLVCGALGLAIAGGVRAYAATPLALWVAAVIGGLAIGAYLTVNLALAMRATPVGRSGAYLGILNVSESIPQILGPVAAAALLRVGSGDPVSGSADNYTALYLSAAALALVSLAMLPALRRLIHSGASPALAVTE